VISTPKVFYPDKPNLSGLSAPAPALKPAVFVEGEHVRSANPTEAGLLRDLRRSRIRRHIWITMAAAQAVYLIAIVLWPH
jgi:hypothetical protein